MNKYQTEKHHLTSTMSRSALKTADNEERKNVVQGTERHR